MPVSFPPSLGGCGFCLMGVNWNYTRFISLHLPKDIMTTSTITKTTDKFAVYFDDGAHSYRLDSFPTSKEAWDCYYEQIQLFKSGDETYELNHLDNYGCVFEVVVLDEEGDYFDTLCSWNKDEDS